MAAEASKIKECIPVGCIPSAAAAICLGGVSGLETPQMWAWRPLPGVGLETLPGVGLETSPGCGPGEPPAQTPKLPPRVWAWRSP